MKYLDNKCKPNKYKIYLNIDINNNIFNGSNLIELIILEKTKNIEFHSQNLNIHNIIIDQIQIEKHNLLFDNNNDIVTIKLDNELNIGVYYLNIIFSGIIDDGYGIIKNSNIIYTRFEPNYARKCFPCWDEPNYKVQYSMSIEINNPTYQVLFNTDPSSSKQNGNQVLYQFLETIPMSTYVSSFIIGQYYYIEKISKHNIRLRVYIPNDINKEDQVGDFALDTGIKALDFITDYYAINFPYNKIDFIPIHNVDVRGMENYGLIFYDSKYLLYNKKSSTIEHLIGTANVIAHELVHQWFGNMVSINKWDELWLKESFAKFFEYFIIDNIYPEWNINSFFVNNLFRTFEFDSISLKPIKIKIKHNKHILQIYDEITYYKGATLLFMLQNYLGNEYFKNCIRNYLIKYKHQSTTSKSFIECLVENLDSNQKEQVNNMIKSFILNKGIPIINLDNQNINIEPFDSKKFIYNIIHNKDIFYNKSNYDWTIPIKLSSTKYLICNSNIDSFNIFNLSKQIPINNNKLYCYYRIAYNDEQFEQVLTNIDKLSTESHMSIINDLFICGIFKLSDFNYWIKYTSSLLINLNKYNNIVQIDYHLIKYLSVNIFYVSDLLKSDFIKNYYSQLVIDNCQNKFKILILNLFDTLIDKLAMLFKIDDLKTYENIDPLKDNLNKLKLLFLILDIDNSKSDLIIKYLYDNKKFDLSPDLNKIIFKKKIKNNIDNIDIYIGLIDNYNHLIDQIITSFAYIENKKVLNEILNIYFGSNKLNITLSQIHNFINKNNYFAKIFTNYFINNYDNFIQKINLDSKSFIDTIHIIILNLDDIDIIANLFKKLNSIDNTQFIIKLTQSKNILFKRLYQKINLIELLNEII